MLCAPSNRRWPFSYHGGLECFCVLSVFSWNNWHKLRKVYRIWQVTTVRSINHNVGSLKELSCRIVNIKTGAQSINTEIDSLTTPTIVLWVFLIRNKFVLRFSFCLPCFLHKEIYSKAAKEQEQKQTNKQKTKTAIIEVCSINEIREFSKTGDDGKVGKTRRGITQDKNWNKILLSYETPIVPFPRGQYLKN